MAPNSPADALGSHAPAVRDVLVEAVRCRHDKYAEAHQAADTRYSIAFGSQWRDLLDDAREELAQRGFQAVKLTPGGYGIPVVNDCLIYVWRIPETPDAVAMFASSPTRKNGFVTPPPPPTLFDEIENIDLEVVEPADAGADTDQFSKTLVAANGTMPVVLVMVQSTPRQLQSIEWGIAVLDDAGKISVHGQECIWEPELVTETEAVPAVESFDSGTPVAPAVALQAQEGPHADG